MKTHSQKRRRGLFSLATVTRYIGVERSAAEGLIANDGLPVVRIPTPKRIAMKVQLPAFHRWLSGRSSAPISMLELEHELERIEA